MLLTRRGRLAISASASVVVVLFGWYAASAFTGSSSASQLITAPSQTPSAVPSPSASPSPVVVRRTPSESPSASAKPRHTTSSSRKPSVHGSGKLVVVPGEGKVVGDGPLRRYKVEVESGIGVSGSSFAAAVERTLGGSKDWGSDYSFKRVSSGSVSFTVTLASPAETDELCRPLDTGGWLSCYNNRGRAVINANRWKYGTSTYGNDVSDYRIYVVSHEVGHALGHNHEYSCRSDGLAPVMMQQTKSLYGCERNPWPHPKG